MPSYELVAHYGALLVFLNVLGSSLGMPVPVMPTLIGVGASYALSSDGLAPLAASMGIALAVAVGAGVLADLVWFRGGKRYGVQALNTVCSLTPARDACMNKTEGFFGAYGVRLLIVSRFVPGLSLVAVPMCGAMGVRMRDFLAMDVLGLLLWAASGLAIGACFARKIQMLLNAVASVGSHTTLMAGCVLISLIAYRYGRRVLLDKAASESSRAGSGTATDR